MKNLIPRFGKRDIASFMDLTYMEYLTAKLPINLPRLMLMHMAYVINVPHHELPYEELVTRIFDGFEVPLDEKEGDEPIKTDFFKETFLNMSQLKRENGVRWLGSGANRRRDDEVNEMDNLHVEGEQADFDWEVVNEDVHDEGEQAEKEDEGVDTGSGEKFYDAVDEERPDDVDVQVPDVAALAPSSVQQKKTDSRVDPSSPVGSLPDSDFMKLQAEFHRAR
ncbi:hypothetical protein Dimus_030377, partial [Dionaea muscipula]